VKTIGEVLKLSTQFLKEKGLERARRLSEELLAGALSVKRMDLYLQFDRPVDEAELVQLRGWIKRCAVGEPLEYVLGEVEFAQCRIAVDSRVLIPRQETEILVDLVVKALKDGPLEGKVLWDLCTGSGCLGLALKKALPSLRVVLSDSSAEALSLAQKNAQKNGLDVEFRAGDLLAPFQNERADFVVCNPPYVAASEYLNLQPSVREFEPKSALVGGERGTEFYERLAHLNPGARVFFEIGAEQGESLKKIFGEGQVQKDWADKDRFFFLEKQ